MTIRTDRNQIQEVKKVVIIFEGKEFIISQDKFGELIINKFSFGEESDTISICPKVSNEIGLK